VRRAGVESTQAPIVFGDPSLSAAAAAALGAAGDVDRVTHGFHTWPAGLHPDAAALLIAALPSGGAVLDPFCGGGTVLVEARIAGRAAIGRDVSPIAVRVATVRAATPEEVLLTRVRAVARRLTAEAREAKEPPPRRILEAVRDWYAPHALWELEALRRGIEATEADVRPFLELCFSSILVKTSWRASDTSPRRQRHHRPPGTAAVLFHKKVRELGRRAAAMRDAVPPGTPEADVRLADARTLVLDAPVDPVLTSPPYPSTYDYLPLQHLRTVWLGLPEGRGEIGARRAWRGGGGEAKRQWVADTAAWTARAAAALKPGGHLVVVIGDGLTPTGAIDASEPTEQGARAAGLESAARASVERIDHAREASRWEHCFVFQKRR
jgi:SAM-dependent methyltransferase